MATWFDNNTINNRSICKNADFSFDLVNRKITNILEAHNVSCRVKIEKILLNSFNVIVQSVYSVFIPALYNLSWISKADFSVDDGLHRSQNH